MVRGVEAGVGALIAGFDRAVDAVVTGGRRPWLAIPVRATRLHAVAKQIVVAVRVRGAFRLGFLGGVRGVVPLRLLEALLALFLVPDLLALLYRVVGRGFIPTSRVEQTEHAEHATGQQTESATPRDGALRQRASQVVEVSRVHDASPRNRAMHHARATKKRDGDTVEVTIN
jgi:hypothetical protein